jgi:hypothetical protein
VGGGFHDILRGIMGDKPGMSGEGSGGTVWRGIYLERERGVRMVGLGCV